MNETEFFPYHNRHIVFELKNGEQKSGVILLYNLTHSNIKTKKKKYVYIPTRNLVTWIKAQKKDKLSIMEELESNIDIEEIVWAEIINY